jgi:hypothetical protein
MNAETVNTIINAGTAGILLFLYMRLEARFDSLQKQLYETNMRMWELLERLATAEAIADGQIRPFAPPPAPPNRTGR